MPEMSTLSSKSKVPMLPSQGVSYAKWGRWVDAFSSCLTLKGLHLFAALDSTMPVEFPEVEDEGESEDEEAKDVEPSTELLNVLTLQYKVSNNTSLPPSQLRRMRFCTRPRRTMSRFSAS